MRSKIERNLFSYLGICFYFLFICFIAEKGNASEKSSILRFYFMPSAPKGAGLASSGPKERINYKSPRALFLSTIEATALNRNHSIGHVNIEIECLKTGTRILTGASSANPKYSVNLLSLQKVGFSILERSWPGRLENEKEINESIKYRGNYKEALSVVTYLISESSCERLAKYVHEYQNDGLPKYYGFSARPRHHEGAGCSAYAASFLELAGLLDDDIKKGWIRTLSVPLDLMAGHLGQESVSFTKVTLSPRSFKWASSNDPQMMISIYDTDMMHDWAVNKANLSISDSINAFKQDFETSKVLMKRYPGIPFDKNSRFTMVDARAVPTPSENIFLGVPELEKVGSQDFVTVVRKGKKLEANGSFKMTPQF